MTFRTLEQLVPLVTYANVIIQGRELDFDIERLSSKYCYKLEFIEEPLEDVAGSTRVIAPDAFSWFSYLKDQDADRVKLQYQPSSHPDLPDHIAAAFVGGGSSWFVEVQLGDASHIYTEMSLGTQPNKTAFTRLRGDFDHLEDSLSISSARDRLDKVLQGLIEFTEEFEVTQHWSEIFKRSRHALTQLQSSRTDEFILNGVYSIEVRQLIEAGFSSDVFGGMGSFSDLGFSGSVQENYSSLSEELYAAICYAILSGVNSYPSE
ncbi:MAG: hypothetical protein RTU30_10190 [Candidatus Thorarchaeota archaeon]